MLLKQKKNKLLSLQQQTALIILKTNKQKKNLLLSDRLIPLMLSAGCRVGLMAHKSMLLVPSAVQGSPLLPYCFKNKAVLHVKAAPARTSHCIWLEQVFLAHCGKVSAHASRAGTRGNKTRTKKT